MKKLGFTSGISLAPRGRTSRSYCMYRSTKSQKSWKSKVENLRSSGHLGALETGDVSEGIYV